MKKSTDLSAVITRIIICFFILLNVFSGVQAQQNKESNELLQVHDNMIVNNVYFSVYLGYGSYSMNGMRRLQNDMVALSGLNANANSSFPSFWLYGASLSLRYDSSAFGFDLESMSTGARSSIADYSGQYTSDFRCSALKFGVFMERDLSFKIKGAKGLSFGYRIEAGGISSNVIQQSQIEIIGFGQGIQSNEFKMSSYAPFLEPTIFSRWQIVNKTFLQFSFGYMLDFPTFIKSKNYLPDYPIGWAGYRMKLGLVRQL